MNFKEAFPFKPYDSQLEFAKSLYDLIDNKQAGIFESPTGTGKSLAIIAGALTWLEDHKHNYQKAFEEKKKSPEKALDQEKEKPPKPASKFPAWFDSSKVEMSSFLAGEKQQQKVFNDMFKEELLVSDKAVAEKVLSKEDLELVEFNENESLHRASRKRHIHHEEEPLDNSFRVIYASRTHSQIHEFVGELKKTKFAKKFSVLEMASRNYYCMNKAVSSMPTSQLMKEKCIETRSSKKGCSFYSYQNCTNAKYELFPEKVKQQEIDTDLLLSQKPSSKSVNSSLNFAPKKRNEDLCDIEDLTTHYGSLKKLCPYYTVRYNSKYADILCMPYSSLMSLPEGVVDFSRCILILDESHNLAETLHSAQSIELTETDIRVTEDQLKDYRAKYRGRLSTNSLYFIDKIGQLVENVRKMFVKIGKEGQEDFSSDAGTGNELLKEGMIQLDGRKLLVELKCVDYDLNKLRRFIVDSELSRKLTYFSYNKKEAEKEEKENKNQKQKTDQTQYSSIEKIFDFFLSLLRSVNTDSSVIFQSTFLNDQKVNSVKFIPLDISSSFNHLVDNCFSVLFTGGTMKPKGQLEGLLRESSKTTIVKDFPPVIDEENLHCSVVSSLPQNELLFNHNNIKNLSKNVVLGLKIACRSF